MMRGVFTRSNYSCSKTLQAFSISLSTGTLYVVCTLNVWHPLMVGWHSISQSGMLFGPSAGEQSSKTLVGLNTGVFFSSYCPQAPPTLFSRWTTICGYIPLFKPQTKNTKKKTVKGELNVFSRELIELLITKKAIAYKLCWCDKIESSCMNGLHKV